MGAVAVDMTFLERRLAQMDRLGSRMGYCAHRGGVRLPVVFVSTVRFGQELWTRVELLANDRQTVIDMVHFEGEIPTRIAGARYWGADAY